MLLKKLSQKLELIIPKAIAEKIKIVHRKIKYHIKKRKKGNLIKYYNIEDLKKQNNLYFHSIKELSVREINNFVFINDDAEITFSPIKSNSKFGIISDEKVYLDCLLKIFKILEKHQRNYNIVIRIENRELLNQSGILEHCNNINLTIFIDCYGYSKEEYLKEDEQLENLIKPLKEVDLSPFEKHLAIYNIVKQFKPYKEEKNGSHKSRFLKYILNNKFIVCVGFSLLFEALSNKVGLPSISFYVDVDTSYDEGFTMENIPTNLRGHQRNISKIDDDQYNIHGIFIVDTTFDNDMEIDLYNNLAMTFDRKKEYHRLESLTDKDLLLDFHNQDDFNKKINFYLKRKIKQSDEEYPYNVIKSYEELYIKIMEILMKLDYPQYQRLHKKYDELLYNKIYIEKSPLKEIENIFSDFLTEYATYIIPLSNKKISDNTLYEVAFNVRKKVDRYTKEELKEWKKNTRKINQMIASVAYPYRYNPNESRPNYLKSRGKRKVKTKNNHH